MNQRDMELLDRELWGVGHHPPQNTAIAGFSLIAMFFVGLALGGILFTIESKPPQIVSNDAMTAILQSESPVVR